MVLCMSRCHQAARICHTVLLLTTFSLLQIGEAWLGRLGWQLQPPTCWKQTLKQSGSRSLEKFSTSLSLKVYRLVSHMDLPYLRALGLPICQNHLEETPSASTLQGWTRLQEQMRAQLKDVDDPNWGRPQSYRIGGLDISFENGTNRATAVLVVCELTGTSLIQIYEDAVDVDMNLPYVSGFLFVRELPAYEVLLQRLRESAPKIEPDVFLVDGSGKFHPRECGSASHFGILHNLRTIGVAKKLLCFEDFDKRAGEQVEQQILPNFGDDVPLIGSSGRVYGLALRTAHPGKKEDASSRRIYVSIGHRFSLDTAKQVILKCCDVGGSYIPEPIRLADLTGRAIERAWKQMQSTTDLDVPRLRQMAMDISNLLDNKQRKTLSGMLEEAKLDPRERLTNVQPQHLKRKQSTIEDLFLPLQEHVGFLAIYIYTHMEGYFVGDIFVLRLGSFWWICFLLLFWRLIASL